MLPDRDDATLTASWYLVHCSMIAGRGKTRSPKRTVRWKVTHDCSGTSWVGCTSSLTASSHSLRTDVVRENSNTRQTRRFADVYKTLTTPGSGRTISASVAR